MISTLLHDCVCLVVDQTRVKLQPIQGAPHDYVNANFMDVSKHTHCGTEHLCHYDRNSH